MRPVRAVRVIRSATSSARSSRIQTVISTFGRKARLYSLLTWGTVASNVPFPVYTGDQGTAFDAIQSALLPGAPDPDLRAAYAGNANLDTDTLYSQLQAEALPYFEKLLQEFEQSEYLQDARKRISELKAQAAAREDHPQ